jgi:hypothetical protein
MTGDKIRNHNHRVSSSDEGCTEAGHRPGFTVRINGKLRIQGYIELLIDGYEQARELNPDLPLQCPAEYLDPFYVARMFGIPLSELGMSETNYKLQSLESLIRRLESGEGDMSSNVSRNTSGIAYHELSDAQQLLLEAASETEPCVGEELAKRAGIDVNSHIRGCLSTLVKLRLLRKASHGYVRERNVTTS